MLFWIAIVVAAAAAVVVVVVVVVVVDGVINVGATMATEAVYRSAPRGVI